MMKDKKIRRIRLLMIFSQLLLTAFVVYWLAERYSSEKVELRKDLLRDFEFSEQKMLDTMIRARMINPLLYGSSAGSNRIALINAQNSKSVIKVTKTSNAKGEISDSGNKNDSIKFNFDIKFDSSDSDTQFLNDTNIAKNIKKINIVRKNPKSEKMLIEGVKVFMSIVNDSVNGTSSSTAVFTDGLDTSILKKQFTEKLTEHKLQPVWITHSDSIKIGTAKIYFKSEMLNGNVGVAVENYTLYLLKKLAPNIIFGFLLLLITGTAFIISFINLKKQLQLNRMRDEFVGNITHELKTPVATVKVALEALNNFKIKDDPTKSAEYIKIASLEMDRLDFLIQKVLNSSIYEEYSNLMNFELVDLDVILHDVIKTMQIRFDNEKATVTFDTIGSDFKINADKFHIQGVITNLLDNSLKYTKGNPSIQITLNSLNSTVELSIADDGIGIPEEFQLRIFEKFFRVPSNNRHNVKGYGLGLSYVEMVVKQHNGTIKVKNNTKLGCTFILTFPKA